MITELFIQRYNKIHDSKICKNVEFDQTTLFTQIYTIINDDLLPSLGSAGSNQVVNLYGISEKIFCREVGLQSLPKSYGSQWADTTSLLNEKDRCEYFILKSTNKWRMKLSLVEILIREYEHKHNDEMKSLAEKTKRRKKLSHPSANNRTSFPEVPKESLKSSMMDKKNAYEEGINEINVRLSKLGLNLRYSNGYFLRSEDNLSTQMVEKPFWDLVRNHPEYQSIESDMLEALDFLAQGKYDKAAQHAFMSFESALKIKFHINGKTTFQKLVDGSLAASPKLNILLSPQYLKDQNSYFRNESSHGPGKGKRNVPSKEEADFAISLCIRSIRLLLETKET